MKAITLYLGLDVHKDSTTLALAEPGPKDEVPLFGPITSEIDRKLGSPISPVHIDLTNRTTLRTQYGCQYREKVKNPLISRATRRLDA